MFVSGCSPHSSPFSMTRLGKHWSAENHFSVAATLFSGLETLFVCWLRWCLLSPRWDHPSFPSLSALVPLPPPYLGPPHGRGGWGAEFNKGSLSHMLKRYANVQVLLFSDAPSPKYPTDCSSLQAKAKHRGREREGEGEFGCLFFRGMDYFVRTAPGYLIWKAITMIAIRINYIMSNRNGERGTWRASLWKEES